MPRDTRAGWLNRIDASADEDAATRETLATLASAQNPDGTAFALPVELLAAAQSLAVSATVTFPSAGAAIATLAAPPAGSYRVRVLAGYGGTPDVVLNMELRVGGTAITRLPVLAVANNLQEVILDRIDLSGSAALTVNAVATGAPTSIFIAHISATRTS